MPVDLNKWIADLEIPADQRQVVLDAIGKGGEKTLKHIEEGILRQEDYSRKQNELAAEKTRLENEYKAKNGEVETFKGELVTWKSGSEKKLQDAVSAREKTEQALAKVNEKIRSLATQYGIPDEEVKSLTSEIPNREDGNQRRTEELGRDFNGKFVSKEEFDSTARNVVKIPAILLGIQNEHLRLFGATGVELDPLQLIEDAEKNKRTLRQEWETKFNVSARREEIKKQQQEAHDAELVKKTEESVRSKMFAEHPELGQTIRKINTQGSPVLASARERMKDVKPDPTFVDESRGVRAAIEKFNSGDYDQGLRRPA